MVRAATCLSMVPASIPGSVEFFLSYSINTTYYLAKSKIYSHRKLLNIQPRLFNVPLSYSPWLHIIVLQNFRCHMYFRNMCVFIVTTDGHLPGGSFDDKKNKIYGHHKDNDSLSFISLNLHLTFQFV